VSEDQGMIDPSRKLDRRSKMHDTRAYREAEGDELVRERLPLRLGNTRRRERSTSRGSRIHVDICLLDCWRDNCSLKIVPVLMISIK
jgi:hypothetical protein